MKNSFLLIAAIGFAAAPSTVAQEPGDAQLATVKQYCVGCHNDKAKIGGISFDGITAESIGKNPELFEKAVRKLRGRVMPPPGAEAAGRQGGRLAGRVARNVARQGSDPGIHHR